MNIIKTPLSAEIHVYIEHTHNTYMYMQSTTHHAAKSAAKKIKNFFRNRSRSSQNEPYATSQGILYLLKDDVIPHGVSTNYASGEREKSLQHEGRREGEREGEGEREREGGGGGGGRGGTKRERERKRDTFSTRPSWLP